MLPRTQAYLRDRKRNFRRAYSFHQPHREWVWIGAGLLALLLAYTLVAWIDASIEEAERIGRAYSQTETHAAETRLVSLLNGRSLRDTTTGEIIFVDVSRQTGL